MGREFTCTHRYYQRSFFYELFPKNNFFFLTGLEYYNAKRGKMDDISGLDIMQMVGRAGIYEIEIYF
jgi:hypothetical protein